MAHCCDCSTRAGAMSLVSALLLTCAWALNVAAIVSCKFVSVTGLEAEGGDLIYGIGLYTVQGRDGYCYVINWNEWTQNIPYWTNSRMNTARICGGVAAFIGFIIMIVAWFLPCFGGAGRCARITVSCFAIVCMILASFMFMVNGSSVCSDGCEFSQGSGLAVGAVLSYFFAGLLLCVAPNPVEEEFTPPPVAAAPSQDQVTVERTEHPDGTVTVKKTTTHPDGSKTVEETTETPVSAPADVEAQAQPVDSIATPVDTSNLVDAKVN